MLGCQLEHQAEPRRLGEGLQYLDGYETQEAAGFRNQGSEVIRVHNQHLWERWSTWHVRLKGSRRGGPRAGTSAPPCPAQPSLLSQTPQGAGVGSPKWNQKAWNFEGKRDLRGLILPSILRRGIHAVVLISEGCHDD